MAAAEANGVGHRSQSTGNVNGPSAWMARSVLGVVLFNGEAIATANGGGQLFKLE
jgi:hypothetical protein